MAGVVTYPCGCVQTPFVDEQGQRKVRIASPGGEEYVGPDLSSSPQMKTPLSVSIKNGAQLEYFGEAIPTSMQFNLHDKKDAYHNPFVYDIEIANPTSTLAKTFLFGKRHGEGREKTTKGETFEGSYVNDVKTGFGTQNTVEGHHYEGSFAEDMWNGQGKLVYQDGSTYDGEFMNDRPHGRGKATNSDKVFYEGDFLLGLPHGFGRYIYNLGTEDEFYYEGEVKRGCREGFGRLELKHLTYEGGFLKNQPHDEIDWKITYQMGLETKTFEAVKPVEIEIEVEIDEVPESEDGSEPPSEDITPSHSLSEVEKPPKPTKKIKVLRTYEGSYFKTLFVDGNFVLARVVEGTETNKKGLDGMFWLTGTYTINVSYGDILRPEVKLAEFFELFKLLNEHSMRMWPYLEKKGVKFGTEMASFAYKVHNPGTRRIDVCFDSKQRLRYLKLKTTEGEVVKVKTYVTHSRDVILWKRGDVEYLRGNLDKNFQINGDNVLVKWKAGFEYRGGMKEGYAQGEGMLNYKRAEFAVGSFSKGNFHGHIHMRIPFGNHFECQFVNGLPQGKGVMTTFEGDRFEAEFVGWNSSRAKGVYHPSGCQFSGSWVLGKRQGLGHYSIPHIGTIEAEWVNDLLPNKMKMVYVDQSEYTGGNVSGFRDGFGKFLSPGRDWSQIGKWKNDVLDGHSTIQVGGHHIDATLQNGKFVKAEVKSGQGLTLKATFDLGFISGIPELFDPRSKRIKTFPIVDMISCPGDAVLPAGFQYHGPLRSGLAQAVGHLISNNGYHYYGHFEKGLRDGKGKEQKAWGHTFEGYFQFGKRLPEGKFWFQTGSQAVTEYQTQPGNPPIPANEIKTLKLTIGKMAILTLNQEPPARPGGKGMYRVMYIGASDYYGHMEQQTISEIEQVLRRHGHGVLEAAHGYKYEGNWENDLEHGDGTATYPDGSRYTGSWYRGVRQGKGKFTFPDGGYQIGVFAYDELDGVAEFVSAAGDVYKGNFWEGFPHGQGNLTYANGDVYEGYWARGFRHGKGVFKEQVTGTTYEGHYVQDKQHGLFNVVDSVGSKRAETYHLGTLLSQRVSDLEQIQTGQLVNLSALSIHLDFLKVVKEVQELNNHFKRYQVLSTPSFGAIPI